MPGPYSDPPRGEPDIAPVAYEESDLLRLLNVLLRNRVLVLWIPLGVAAAIAVVMLFQPRMFRSEATFAPRQTQRLPSAISGLAQEFGIPLQGDRLDQSPAFYEDLVRSREILGPIVDRPWNASLLEGDEPRTLIELYDIDHESEVRRRASAIADLRKAMRVASDNATGVVAFSVSTPTPELAQAVAQEVIEQVNAFNLRRRQEVAGAERTFIEDRLNAATAELTSAEARLQQFDERNLRIDNSPELRLERDRLLRKVAEQQQVVTMLRQVYEQARIDEVRNTPAITVIERPSLPVHAEPRGTLQFALLGFLVTAFVMTGLVLSRELYHRIQVGDTRAHQEFRELRRSMRGWLPVRRRGRRG